MTRAFLRFASAFFLLSLGTCGTLHGDSNWPQFRGPAGQGHGDGTPLPLVWSNTTNVVWKRELPGSGWSSPVVVKDRIYLTTGVEGSGASALSLRALCLDAATGGELWSTEVFRQSAEKVPGHHGKNTQASPTPIVDGERLFVHFGHLGTACLDLAGKIRWTNSSLPYSSVHGNGGSPALVGDRLIFNCDGANDPFIVALDAATGEPLWKTARVTKAQRKFSFSTPLAIQVAGKTQVISAGSGAVSALDPKDGRELWRVSYGEGYSVVPRPVFAHGLVFLASGFDRPSALAIRPDGSGDVTDSHVAWTIAKGAPNTPSLLVVGDEVYFVSDAGIATCADARSGRVHWTERLGGNYSSSPVHAGGRILFVSEEGVGSVLKPGTTFALLAKNELKERVLASPALASGALFLRGEKHLFRIESR